MVNAACGAGLVCSRRIGVIEGPVYLRESEAFREGAGLQICGTCRLHAQLTAVLALDSDERSRLS
jgi:hypothetical protein